MQFGAGPRLSPRLPPAIQDLRTVGLWKQTGDARSALSDSDAAPSAHHKVPPRYERPHPTSFGAGSYIPPPTRAVPSEPRERSSQERAALVVHGRGTQSFRRAEDYASRGVTGLQSERHRKMT